MPWRSLAATFPAIHPFAVVIVFVINKYRLGWLDQTLFRGKKFIRRERHASTETRLLKLNPLAKGIFRNRHC